MTSQAHPAAPDPDGTAAVDATADSEKKNNNQQRREDTVETATDADTADSDKPTTNNNNNNDETTTTIVVSSSRKARPPYKYDPNKITLRFLFANRDGLAATVECKPSDTVGEVKGALLSVWPDGESLHFEGNNISTWRQCSATPRMKFALSLT